MNGVDYRRHCHAESERDYRLTGTSAAAAAAAGSGGSGGGGCADGTSEDGGGGGAGRAGGVTWKVTSDEAAGEEWLSGRLKRLTKGGIAVARSLRSQQVFFAARVESRLLTEIRSALFKRW